MKSGNLFETREGMLYLYHDQALYYLNLTTNNSCLTIGHYQGYNHTKDSKYDIMKVYEDYTCTKVIWERPEVKPETKLSKVEKLILENRPKGYDYIARDNNNTLFLHTNTPRKNGNIWYSDEYIEIYSHLFKMITPANYIYVPDLLKS